MRRDNQGENHHQGGARALIQLSVLIGMLSHTATANRVSCGLVARVPTSTRASLLVGQDPHREFAQATPESAANQTHAPPLLEPQDQSRKPTGILPDPLSPLYFANNFLQLGAPCGKESCCLQRCLDAQEHGSALEKRRHQAATLSPHGARV